MSDDTKAAWFLDGDLTPTSTLVERLRKPERVIVNEAGFTMLFSSSDKLDAADRIEKLEALVEQLRNDNSSMIDDYDTDFLRQEKRIEKLEAALTPFLKIPIGVADDDPAEMEVYQCHGWPSDQLAVVTVADFRRAQNALEGKDD